MAGGLNKPAMTLAGIAGLCVSVAAGFGLGAYTVTGVDPLYAEGPHMTTTPYAGAERDNRAAAAPDPVVATTATSTGAKWVGQESGTSDL